MIDNVGYHLNHFKKWDPIFFVEFFFTDHAISKNTLTQFTLLMSTDLLHAEKMEAKGGYFIIFQWHSYRKEQDLIVLKCAEYTPENKKEQEKKILSDCENYASQARKYWIENPRVKQFMFENNCKIEAEKKFEPKLDSTLDIKGEPYDDYFEHDTVCLRIFDIPLPQIGVNNHTFLKIQYSTFNRSPLSCQWDDNSFVQKNVRRRMYDPISFVFSLEELFQDSNKRNESFCKSWLSYP